MPNKLKPKTNNQKLFELRQRTRELLHELRKSKKPLKVAFKDDKEDTTPTIPVVPSISNNEAARRLISKSFRSRRTVQEAHSPERSPTRIITNYGFHSGKTPDVLEKELEYFEGLNQFRKSNPGLFYRHYQPQQKSHEEKAGLDKPNAEDIYRGGHFVLDERYLPVADYTREKPWSHPEDSYPVKISIPHRIIQQTEDATVKAEEGIEALNIKAYIDKSYAPFRRRRVQDNRIYLETKQTRL